MKRIEVHWDSLRLGEFVHRTLLRYLDTWALPTPSGSVALTLKQPLRPAGLQLYGPDTLEAQRPSLSKGTSASPGDLGVLFDIPHHIYCLTPRVTALHPYRRSLICHGSGTMAKEKQVATDFQKIITEGELLSRRTPQPFIVASLTMLSVHLQAESANRPKSLLRRSFGEIVSRQHHPN